MSSSFYMIPHLWWERLGSLNYNNFMSAMSKLVCAWFFNLKKKKKKLHWKYHFTWYMDIHDIHSLESLTTYTVQPCIQISPIYEDHIILIPWKVFLIEKRPLFFSQLSGLYYTRFTVLLNWSILFFQLDVVTADLDGGYLSIPECVNLLLPSDAMYERINYELTMVSLTHCL